MNDKTIDRGLCELSVVMNKGRMPRKMDGAPPFSICTWKKTKLYEITLVTYGEM